MNIEKYVLGVFVDDGSISVYEWEWIGYVVSGYWVWDIVDSIFVLVIFICIVPVVVCDGVIHLGIGMVFVVFEVVVYDSVVGCVDEDAVIIVVNVVFYYDGMLFGDEKCGIWLGDSTVLYGKSC